MYSVFEKYNNWLNKKGSFDDFYKVAVRISQYYACKFGKVDEKDEIATTVIADMYIKILNKQKFKSEGDITGCIRNLTKYEIYRLYKNPIYARTVFVDFDNFDTLPISDVDLKISKRWRTEEYISYVRKYAENHNLKECMRFFGYTYNSMRSFVQKYKIKTKPELRKFESRKEEAVKWCLQKKRSLNEIMEYFSISKDTAFRFTKKNKIPIKKVESVCVQYDSQIRDMRNKGCSWQIISDKFNIAFGTLYSYVKSKGIE